MYPCYSKKLKQFDDSIGDSPQLSLAPSFFATRMFPQSEVVLETCDLLAVPGVWRSNHIICHASDAIQSKSGIGTPYFAPSARGILLLLILPLCLGKSTP